MMVEQHKILPFVYGVKLKLNILQTEFFSSNSEFNESFFFCLFVFF